MDETRAEIAHRIMVGEGSDQREIAYRTLDGTGPALVWLGGYRSDMRGAKAEHLRAFAEETGRAFLRLDYSGHGESGGAFADGTISRWCEEARRTIEASGARNVVLVGSSMGAWIALRLLARSIEEGTEFAVAGLMLLAPAPDFTEKLVRPRLGKAELETLETKGFVEEPSEYGDEPTIYTKRLIEDGAANLVMSGPIETRCPVAILQGMADPDVPYSHALELLECLPGADVTMTLVRDGDHRLSRPQDLVLLSRVLSGLLSQIEAKGP